jgi:O-acetyl-ADP-ribose deacetylase (regulator of RNase III)
MPTSEIRINQAILSLVQGDITTQATDVIVNAANPELKGGGGVDGAIHGAGGPSILKECRQIVARQGNLSTGKAVITGGGNLKARYVIHTVGPIWHGGNSGEAELLASAYRESLKLAAGHNLSSIAFPSISTGVYVYPLDRAAKIAIETVSEFLKESDTSIREVVFVLFSRRAYDCYAEALASRAVNE